VNRGEPIEAALAAADPQRASDERPPSVSTWLCRLGDAERPLPAGFDPTSEHHMRLEKGRDHRLSLWLDGQPIATVDAPPDVSRVALFTDGAAAAFRDVAFTGLGGRGDLPE
jgi:hypothetical protein